MTIDNFNLIESVVYMTRERDKHALAEVVVKTLVDLLACKQIFLLDVLPSEHSFMQIAACYSGSNGNVSEQYPTGCILLDEALIQCCKNHGVQVLPERETTRYLYPVLVNQRIVSVLDLTVAGAQAGLDERLLSGVVGIYANFLGIIDDSEHDALTHLFNRRTFDAQVSGLLSASRNMAAAVHLSPERRHAQESRHWLGVLDIDHFKSINDNFGHVYGDEVLIIFADLMRTVFRGGDLLFRYGGEEFVVVLVNTSKQDAKRVFDRFREQLSARVFPQIGQVTVSIGMVDIGEQDHPASIFECADKALYFAKENGRDQVCEYADLVAKGMLQVRRSAGDVDLF